MSSVKTAEQRWGRWRVIAENDQAVTLQCSCGAKRTIERTFWDRRRWRLSVKCRQCSNRVESDRMSRFIFGKSLFPPKELA